MSKKQSKFLIIMKNLMLGKISTKINVEDIVLAETLITKEFMLTKSRHKSKITRNYLDNQITLLIRENIAPKYVFQDILYSFAKENPETLLLIGSHQEINLTKEDKDIYKARGETPPQKKKILRIFFGSTHKPFDTDFNLTLNLECDTDGFPIIDRPLEVKINEIFKYYNFFTKRIRIISPFMSETINTKNVRQNERLLSMFDTDETAYIKFEIQKDLKFIENDEIRKIFSNIQIFEKINKRKIFSIISIFFTLLLATQAFNWSNNQTNDSKQKNIDELYRHDMKIKQQKRKNLILEDELKHKQKMISSEMKTYYGE